jgi:PAS domain S-box-containing protein
MRFKNSPLLITLIYSVLGITWVITSTLYLNSQFDKPNERTLNEIQGLIRLSFIIFSALILYFLIKSFNKKVSDQAHQYQALFDENPNPMWVYDLKTLKFLAVNYAAVIKYEYSKQEFLAMTIKDIRPPEDIAKLEKSIERIRDRFYSSGIWRHVKKSGDLIFVEITSHQILYNGRKAELILSNDVTDRIIAQNKIIELNEELANKVEERTHQLLESNHELQTTNEELATANEELHAANEHLVALQNQVELKAKQLIAQSEDKLNSILNNIKVVVWSMSLSTKELLYVNKTVEELFGYPLEELYKNPEIWIEATLPEDRIPLDVTITRLRQEGFIRRESRVLHKDNSQRWVETITWLVYDENNEPIRIDGIISDISDKKSAEIKIDKQNELLEKLFDNVPLMVCLFDNDRKFSFINKAFESTLGWSASELLGESIFTEKIQHASQLEHTREFIRQKENYWSEFMTKTKDGKYKNTSWTNTQLSDGTLLCLGQDITQAKNDELEKNKLIKKLLEQNEGLLRFSYIVSHNLRGPVASLLGLVQLIDKSKILDEHTLSVINHINTSSLKLDEVIRDLSKILEIQNEGGQHMEWIPMEEIISYVTQELRNLITEHNAKINFNFSKNPSCYSIRRYIQSIILKLVANGIKYHDSRVPEITIESFKQDNHFGLLVKDNGVGIDLKKHQEKIFSLYQRFHNHVEGKGFGLYMVKTQVESLGGSIEVESTPGIGTTFKILLPPQS